MLPLLALAKIGLSLAKKAKKRKAQKAESNEQLRQLELKRQGQVIERAGLVANQAGENRDLASKLSTSGVAGGPAAAERVKIQREGQARDLAQQDLGIQSTNFSKQHTKKVKKAGKMDVTSFF